MHTKRRDSCWPQKDSCKSSELVVYSVCLHRTFTLNTRFPSPLAKESEHVSHLKNRLQRLQDAIEQDEDYLSVGRTA